MQQCKGNKTKGTAVGCMECVAVFEGVWRLVSLFVTFCYKKQVFFAHRRPVPVDS